MNDDAQGRRGKEGGGAGTGCRQSGTPRRGIGSCFPFVRVLIMRCITRYTCVERNSFVDYENFHVPYDGVVRYHCVSRNLEMNKSKPREVSLRNINEAKQLLIVSRLIASAASRG